MESFSEDEGAEEGIAVSENASSEVRQLLSRKVELERRQRTQELHKQRVQVCKCLFFFRFSHVLITRSRSYCLNLCRSYGTGARFIVYSVQRRKFRWTCVTLADIYEKHSQFTKVLIELLIAITLSFALCAFNCVKVVTVTVRYNSSIKHFQNIYGTLLNSMSCRLLTYLFKFLLVRNLYLENTEAERMV